jgi:hypothetical protein
MSSIKGNVKKYWECLKIMKKDQEEEENKSKISKEGNRRRVNE